MAMNGRKLGAPVPYFMPSWRVNGNPNCSSKQIVKAYGRLGHFAFLLFQHYAAVIMAPIKLIEYFRVPPRWLFVKISDAEGNIGWGEASLEGHTEAVEGCLDAFIERFVGSEAE